MAKLYSLARVSTATTGTGTITLGAAVSGYLTFALAGVANGDVVSYGIKDGANSEVGTGTYTSSGTTLTRTVTKSTNSDAAISLSGSAEVFITPRKEDLLSITETATTNHVFAGAASGGAAAPAFRALVAADLPAASDTAIGALEIAIQSEMEAGSSTTLAVTPGRQHNHPSAAKHWCKWGVTSTILASYNVTSVTDTGTGNWTVVIATDYSSANWSPVYTVVATVEYCTATDNHTVTNQVCRCYTPSTGSAADPTGNSAAGFGDQ